MEILLPKRVLHAIYSSDLVIVNFYLFGKVTKSPNNKGILIERVDRDGDQCPQNDILPRTKNAFDFLVR
jgi:hypothetical protein